VLAQSINPSEYTAVAVSVEPNGGSPQPTTKPIIVVPLA
jgi:anti-sigma-K factor RskA